MSEADRKVLAVVERDLGEVLSKIDSILALLGSLAGSEGTALAQAGLLLSFSEKLEAVAAKHLID